MTVRIDRLLRRSTDGCAPNLGSHGTQNIRTLFEVYVR
jgi:hypothetical protein